MRVVLQRATTASVTVDGQVVGRLDEPGLVALVGINRTDGPEEARALAAKTHKLRIMRDELSVGDLGAPVLAISQFTLYADTRKGRRPSWNDAAPGPQAEPVFEAYVAALRALGVHVETGRFGADMAVALVNDGPVTLILEA